MRGIEPPSRIPLRLGLVDMNNGVKNEAIRCFHRILGGFKERVQRANERVEIVVTHVQPRNLQEAAPRECDLYLSTGGPGSPFDGYDDHWCTKYRDFLDSLIDEALRGHDDPRAALVVCHSFEIAIAHTRVAKMVRRPTRKFGMMPVYPTPAGLRSPLLAQFGERFFAWEHRDWQAVGLDRARLAEIGGELWATESRVDAETLALLPDTAHKGDGLLVFRFASNLEGTQFHPEADKDGALAWLLRPEQTKAAIDAYGELTYQRMLKSLDDPERLERTFERFIPGWLVRKFNELAPGRHWSPISL
jgi:GMP synthase-like glutamine amidotransferase